MHLANDRGQFRTGEVWGRESEEQLVNKSSLIAELWASVDDEDREIDDLTKRLLLLVNPLDEDHLDVWTVWDRTTCNDPLAVRVWSTSSCLRCDSCVPFGVDTFCESTTCNGIIICVSY